MLAYLFSQFIRGASYGSCRIPGHSLQWLARYFSLAPADRAASFGFRFALLAVSDSAQQDLSILSVQLGPFITWAWYAAIIWLGTNLAGEHQDRYG